MFGRLLSKFQKPTSDHPLGNAENLAATLSEIPQHQPESLLADVDHWLSGMEGYLAEIGPQQALSAVMQLDSHAHGGANELLDRYLTPSRREHLADSVWSVLDTHAGVLLEAYRMILEALAAQNELTVTKPTIACAAARALRAWSLRKKLLHFRYRPVAESFWLVAHELVKRSQDLLVSTTRSTLYPAEAESTPLAEYLIGIYLELAPLSNLVPLQLELVERFLRDAGTLEFSDQKRDGSSHSIDLSLARGPRRMTTKDATKDAAEGGRKHYLAPARLRNSVMTLARGVNNAATQPDWLASLPLSAQQLNSALLALVEAWSPAPPQRSAERNALMEEIRVVFGFSLARRVIAYSMFARMGRRWKYEVADLEKHHEQRFGHALDFAKSKTADGSVTAAEETEFVSPLDVLQHMETEGDRQQMEVWRQTDSSAKGMGANVPAIRSRHAIGALVAIRFADGLVWRVCLIRRIGRDSQGRPNIGLESLPWPSMPALAHLEGDSVDWLQSFGGGHDWLDGILLSHDGDQVLFPAGAFVANGMVKLKSDEGVWLVRMVRLLDRGVDFDRIQFERCD